MAFETISTAKESELEKCLESPDFDWRQFPMLTGNGTSNNSGKFFQRSVSFLS
jgi:hypothetical protein